MSSPRPRSSRSPQTRTAWHSSSTSDIRFLPRHSAFTSGRTCGGPAGGATSTAANAAWCTPSAIRRGRSTFADLARPYLPDAGFGADDRRGAPSAPSAPGPPNWRYLSFDETSGYGVAADRCRSALEESGIEVDWTPFVPGGGWGLGYQPAPAFDLAVTPPGEAGDSGRDQVVVAHLVPEYFPALRDRCPTAYVVGHTAWETDRIPDHWIECLDAADLLVVPSHFSAEAITSSAVTTPVAVVPHVAPTVVERASPTWGGIPKDAFVFYTIAEWNERKAVFHTIEAYLKAFRAGDPVLLVVKTSYRDWRSPPPAGGQRRRAGDERVGSGATSGPVPRACACPARDPGAERR